MSVSWHIVVLLYSCFGIDKPDNPREGKSIIRPVITVQSSDTVCHNDISDIYIIYICHMSYVSAP